MHKGSGNDAAYEGPPSDSLSWKSYVPLSCTIIIATLLWVRQSFVWQNFMVGFQLTQVTLQTSPEYLIMGRSKGLQLMILCWLCAWMIWLFCSQLTEGCLGGVDVALKVGRKNNFSITCSSPISACYKNALCAGREGARIKPGVHNNILYQWYVCVSIIIINVALCIMCVWQS